MNPRAFFLCAVLMVCVWNPGLSQTANLSRRYAHALQHYNPTLSARYARQLADATLAVSDAAHLDARLLVALIATESRWRPAARSRVGARGLGQLMPGTAAELGVNPDDPFANLLGAAKHLRTLLNTYANSPIPKRYELALAAYNAGSGAVARYRGIPPYPETRAYVTTVMARWAALAGVAWTP